MHTAQAYVAMMDPDRERAMTRRALERAARAGGEQRPGLARGGFASFAKFLRSAGTTITHIQLGGPSSTPRLSGSTGI
jgi:hypothetical protein